MVDAPSSIVWPPTHLIADDLWRIVMPS